MTACETSASHQHCWYIREGHIETWQDEVITLTYTTHQALASGVCPPAHAEGHRVVLLKAQHHTEVDWPKVACFWRVGRPV